MVITREMGVGLRVMGWQGVFFRWMAMRACLHEEKTKPWKTRVLAWRVAIGGWALGGNLLFGKSGESGSPMDPWLRLRGLVRFPRLELTQC